MVVRFFVTFVARARAPPSPFFVVVVVRKALLDSFYRREDGHAWRTRAKEMTTTYLFGVCVEVMRYAWCWLVLGGRGGIRDAVACWYRPRLYLHMHFSRQGLRIWSPIAVVLIPRGCLGCCPLLRSFSSRCLVWQLWSACTCSSERRSRRVARYSDRGPTVHPERFCQLDDEY